MAKEFEYCVRYQGSPAWRSEDGRIRNAVIYPWKPVPEASSVVDACNRVASDFGVREVGRRPRGSDKEVRTVARVFIHEGGQIGIDRLSDGQDE